MFTFVAFSLKRAVQGVWRNRLMSLAAAATMVLMLVLLSGLIILLTGLDATLRFAEDKVEVQATLLDTAPMDQVTVVENQLKQMPQVTSVTYISKDQALADFRQPQADHADLIQYLESNPLPASLEIKLRSPDDYLDVANYLQGQTTVVDKVRDLKSVVTQMITITSVLRTGGLIGLAVVGFTVLFIIVNTIRLAVVARAEEIEIMRLVGASDAFIRWPFIFEGALVGLLAALVTIGLLLSVQQPLAGFMTSFFQALPIDTSAMLGQNLALIVLGTGIGMGVLGSWVSVRSYLIK